MRRPPLVRGRLGLIVGAAVLAAVALGMAGAGLAQTLHATAPGSQSPMRIFRTNCASCHGMLLTDSRGPSLLNDRLLAAHNDAELLAIIKAGHPDRGMPSFAGVYSDDELKDLIAFLRVQGGILKARPAFMADPDNRVIKSRKETFRIRVMTPGLDTPWGLAFLPDGRMLVTERVGRLRIIARDGTLNPEPVKGIPAVWARQDGGLLDVAVHPDFAHNGWVYLSYVETATRAAGPKGDEPSVPNMTVIIRGRISPANEWVDTQVLFRAPLSLYTPSGEHYGSRFLFDGKGHLFYSIGERGVYANAQSLASPLGKIHRINDDGTIPADNPFVHTPGALPSIWSYGHRNPEGMAWSSVTGLLWESEHGPTDGDEINVIDKGHNYGWGVITSGTEPGITKTHQAGMEQPIVFYTPSIAPSGINFYTGDRFPGWKNSLFVAGLIGNQLRRLEIKDRRVVSQEVVLNTLGRTRQVLTGPDGYIYVLAQNATGIGTQYAVSRSPGMLVRLEPVK